MPTYRQHAAVTLSPAAANAMFVPEGCAHGFLVIEGEALVMYAQSGEWDSVHEGGVLWSSVGVEWPIALDGAVLSDRDAAFPPLDAFETPFDTPTRIVTDRLCSPV